MRYLAVCWLVLIGVVTANVVYAEDGVTRTEHFDIFFDGGDAESVGAQMEARFGVYNRLFRFDPEQAALPLRVRAFTDTDAYNAYVESRLEMPALGAVYLHYPQTEKRELVINCGSAEEKSALPYQAFVHFFRAFVAQPPAWMREGFAVFFSTLIFTGEGRLAYEENLAWLETVKTMRNRPAIEEILLADDPAGADFQALAWSLVSFFINSGKEEYSRALTDSFMALSNANTGAQNAQAVMKRIMLGNSADDLAKDYENYLDSRKTFAELIDGGQMAYNAGDRLGAELSFRSALEQKPGHFVPLYYLGLLAYEKNDFAAAELFYQASMRGGADQPLVLYALGINAAAAGKNAQAVDYLRQAATSAPERYRDKAEHIISRLAK
jgi:tetratricopeptide (TPR) repeat protein